MSNVTMKSTKQEIMDALLETQKKLKEKASNSFNPVKQAEIKREEEVVESAVESVSQNLFSEELNKKFIELNEAIEINSKKLQEVYEIDKEFQSIILITESKKLLAEQLDNNYNKRKEEIENTIKLLENEYSEKNKTLKEEHNRTIEDLKLERKREQELFDYNLKRLREKENDAWEDEKSIREKEIAKKEELTKTLLEEANSKIDHIKELEKKVEEIEVLTEKAKQEGIEQATKDLGKEYGYKKTMYEKDSEHEKQKMQYQIDMLTKELDKVNSEKDVIENKLDSAYKQLSELATRTVESSGGVKILNSGNNNDARK